MRLTSRSVSGPAEKTREKEGGISLCQRALATVGTPEKRQHFLISLVGVSLTLMLVLSMFENNSKIGRIIFSAIPLLIGAWGWLRGWFTLKDAGPVVWAVPAVLATILISCAFSINPGYSFKAFYNEHLWFALLFLVVGMWATTTARHLTYLHGLMTAGAISAVLGLVLFYFAGNLQEAGLIEKTTDFLYSAKDSSGNTYWRAAGTLESYTRSAMAIVISLPATLAIGLLALRGRLQRWELLVAVVIALLSVWYLLLTKSRGAWVGAGIACGVTYVLMRGPWKLAVAGAALLALLVVALPQERARAYTMVKHLSQPDLLLSGRFDLWEQGKEPIQEHPWTGVGYGGNIFLTEQGLAQYELETDRRQPDLHSVYFQTLAEVGILGSAAYLSMMLLLWYGAIRALKVDWKEQQLPGLHAGTGILCGFLAMGAVYYYNETPLAHLVWPTLGLVAAGWSRVRASQTGNSSFTASS